MKQCSECGAIKPLDEFQKRARSKDGRTNLCKPCKRAYDNDHYSKTPERRNYIRANSDARILANRGFIIDYFLDHPCVDCGETDPVVLEFDHRGDKLGNVSKMIIRNSLATLKAEVAKCDVRCANCHRRKTAKDFGYWRTL